MKYRIIDKITSDVMFEVYGKDKKELFSNAAEALFGVVCEIKKVKPEKKVKVKVKGKDLKDLLYNWLENLIGLVDIREMFFSKFDIKKITDKALEADVYGETTSKEKSGTVVKAITYYEFKLEKTDKGYKAVVSLDI